MLLASTVSGGASSTGNPSATAASEGNIVSNGNGNGNGNGNANEVDSGVVRSTDAPVAAARTLGVPEGRPSLWVVTAGSTSGSVQTLTLPSTVASSPRTSVATSGADASAATPTGFTAVRELGAIDLASDVTSVVPLPSDTFQHASQPDGFTLSAAMADGSPLPSWVSFDPAAGTFTLRPPQGTVGDLQLTITARDRQGRAASADLTLNVTGRTNR